MPVELQQQVAVKYRSLGRVAVPAPADSDSDDWAGVFCCSAMRPRNQADVLALRAAGAADHPHPADED